MLNVSFSRLVGGVLFALGVSMGTFGGHNKGLGARALAFAIAMLGAYLLRGKREDPELGQWSGPLNETRLPYETNPYASVNPSVHTDFSLNTNSCQQESGLTDNSCSVVGGWSSGSSD